MFWSTSAFPAGAVARRSAVTFSLVYNGSAGHRALGRTDPARTVGAIPSTARPMIDRQLACIRHPGAPATQARSRFDPDTAAYAPI